jgi:glycogen debranching enzyme
VAANVRDVASFPLLDGPPDEWLAPQAGVPLYPAFFGRDGLTAGWQAGMIDGGDMLDASLTRLGRRQSTRVDDWHDEEPGRIPYQMRTGPLAVLGLNPYDAYYADYASPLMFVIALANLYAWSGDLARIDRHWDAARRILDWARDYGDHDRDGYLEYHTRSSKGTKNQGWKDSGDAIVYDDGSVVPAPIATCELQGYWYAAQQLMGLLCAAKGLKRESTAYLEAASALKERFNRDWWSEREQCIALAMDPDKRLIEAPTSNAGHCLATGIVDRARLDAVVGRLFAPDMFSGWGVRTLSSAHTFYDPLSYHRGSVWAVEQATILFGLRRFGFDGRVHDLADALFELALLYPQYRIPETIGGYSRRERPSPGAYPQANAPQLWNASTLPLVVQSLAGIIPWAAKGILIVDPILPAWLPEIVVHDLRVGDQRVTLRFTRRPDGTSDFDVVRHDRGVHVVRQPPPEAVSAGAADRVNALVDTLFA